MSRIFGEINEPESRAFWDEHDCDNDDIADDMEIESSHFQYTLQWLSDEVMPSKILMLTIVEGNIVAESTISCMIGDAKEICVINHGRYKPSIIYKVNDDLYICSVSSDLQAHHSIEFTHTIHEFLTTAKNIVTVTCQHISSYKSDSMDRGPSVLRSLSTDNAKALIYDVPSIKQPNIICGISAAILSYAKIHGFIAAAYVLYVEDFIFDSETAMPLRELYSRMPGFALVQQPTFKRSGYLSNSNLYM